MGGEDGPGTRVVSAAYDKSVRIWDTNTQHVRGFDSLFSLFCFVILVHVCSL